MGEVINSDALKELQAARAEVQKQKQAIIDEMSQRAAKMQLWTNGQCAAWGDYVRAEAELQRLRDMYEV